MSLDLCLKQLHVHINVFHGIQYILLLLFYSVIFQSAIYQSCKFQSPATSQIASITSAWSRSDTFYTVILTSMSAAVMF